MKKEYIKVASIPEEEKIVSTIKYGGFHYWNFKYPFRHYKELRLIIATEKAIYEINLNKE